MYHSAYPNKYMDDLAILPVALKSYIPKQLFRHVDMEKVVMQSEYQLVQSFLDNSNGNLRMYGSAESLLNNLWSYMNFPLRRKMFPLQMGHYHHTIPDIYRTLKGDTLYCKQDYLFHLQSCVYYELKLWDDEQKSKYAELIEYMKKHEKRLSGCYEFIKYDHETFENIQKFFFNTASLQSPPEDSKTTVTIEPAQITPNINKDFIKVFNDLISKYPCFFLPNSETKDKNAAAVVRVFDDSHLKFVMESELFAAINLKNPDRKPLECMDTDGHYRIVEYKLVLEMFRDQIADIDFIYYSIAHCEHRAVPIATPSGDHCILAVDAFLDILSETFFSEVFKKFTRNTCHMIPKFIVILEKYFPSNIKYQYFINLEVLQKLREELDEFWEPIEDKPVEKIRNVGPNGFTVENLKKELKRLGYTKIFSEISAEARTAYTFLVEGRKPNELETKDMFRAIEACLMAVVFKRFPCLQEFMYRQKVCTHNRKKPCDFCSKAFKDVEARIKAESEQDAISSIANAFIEASTETTAITTLIESALKVKTSKRFRESLHKAEDELKRIDEPEDSGISLESSKTTEGNSEPNPVLPDSITSLCKILMEASYRTKEKVIYSVKKVKTSKSSEESTAEAEPDLNGIDEPVITEAPSIKVTRSEVTESSMKSSPEHQPLPISKVSEETSESDLVLSDSCSSIRKKCMEASNEALISRELEKGIEEKNEKINELSETKKSLNQEDEDLKVTVNELLQQLKDKDEEMNELKIANSKLKKSQAGEQRKYKTSLSKLESSLEKKVCQRLEWFENNDSKIQELEMTISRITQEKNEEIEKLKKQQTSMTKETMKKIEKLELKSYSIFVKKNEEIEKLKQQQVSMAKETKKNMEELKEKNSIIQELELKNSSSDVKKNDEIEKLKQQQVSVTKQNKKDIEQLKRNASKSANEVKKLTAKISEKEATENQLKQSNKELLEKLQKSDSNLQEIIKKQKNLEIEVSNKNRTILESADEVKKLTAKISEKESEDNGLNRSINEILETVRKSDSNLREVLKTQNHMEAEIAEKNRIIQELRKSAEKHVSEQENAKEERETEISSIREILDRMSPPELKEKPDTECLICFYEMRPDQKTLNCEHCRKIVHLECASKWLKIHRSCAHCRREQLDPNEFPSLR